MNKILVVFLLFVCLLIQHINAQEVVQQLETRLQESQNTLKLRMLASSKTSLTLPFFDDFSYNSHSASTNNWLKNKCVYINSTYAHNPPSIGVATFDALNGEGVPYENASQLVRADSLISLPINLAIAASDVCLSFFYQAQGNDYVDAPENKDSLVLDFYKPLENKWVTVWAVNGESRENFKQVVIHIKDAAFLKDGFQFKFHNYISYYTDNDYAGKIGNCDFWHIDYVKLTANGDSTVNDVAITEPLHSMLNNYESMPWKHFKDNEAALSELSDIINLTVRNNYPKEQHVDRLYHLREIHTGGSSSTFGKDAFNIKSDTTQVLEIERTVSFESSKSDSAIFELQAELGTLPKDIKSNDTVRYEQIFKNYYAYDDGSAEAGYGVIGSGAKSARVALQFNVLASDTLQAVDMYFNQALANANQKAFYLTIWKDDKGIPGDTLQTQKIDKPLYANTLNRFSLYQLKKPLFLEKGIYYIGWSQRYDEFLNIGLDINKNSSSKLFCNLTGDWTASTVKGSIMLRPYFGEQKTLIHTAIPTQSALDLKLYPNPANEYCQISKTEQPIRNIKVYDITGRIQNVAYSQEGRIETLGLKSGMYLVNITVGNQTTNLRLVVTR